MKLSMRVMAILGLAPLLAGVPLRLLQTPPPVSQPHINGLHHIMENRTGYVLGSQRPYINQYPAAMASRAELSSIPAVIQLPTICARSRRQLRHLNADPPSANHQSTTNIWWLAAKERHSWRLTMGGHRRRRLSLVRNGLYAVKHNPFVYFDDVTTTGIPIPRTASATCARSANGRISPTMPRAIQLHHRTVNDMHDSCVAAQRSRLAGDPWLSQKPARDPRLEAYRSGGSVFVTWDDGAVRTVRSA